VTHYLSFKGSTSLNGLSGSTAAVSIAQSVRGHAVVAVLGSCR